ncbi:hypothetical protein Bbelb_443930 [Branchiostoma belcheri]|nr:hypothetical protein Bbelb_443930 [Branchiostoma belcheri]
MESEVGEGKAPACHSPCRDLELRNLPRQTAGAIAACRGKAWGCMHRCPLHASHTHVHLQSNRVEEEVLTSKSDQLLSQKEQGGALERMCGMPDSKLTKQLTTSCTLHSSAP